MQYVSINNCSSSLCKVEIGVLQGSSLGPLLFLLYINDISNSVSSIPRLFADDTCLLVNAATPDELQNKLKSELSAICNWMTANKLSLNTNKLNALFISPKQNIPLPEINVNCVLGIIKSVNKAKYLGINLDNKLNFRDHIKLIEMKIARSVGILNKLKHYLNKPSLKKLYHFLISSHINYGLLVWGSTYPSYLTK